MLEAAAARARDELAGRQRARDGLLAFTCFTQPTYAIGPHHGLIGRKLEAVEAGTCKRLMVFAPPRHGKSELVSRRFPAWALGRRPSRQVISASYGQDLANDFGRDVRNIIAQQEYGVLFPGIGLAEDSAARNRWHTNKGGAYAAVGVGGAITGRGADILVIDDVVKDYEAAASQTIRDATWNWYLSTAYTRLMPGGAIVVTLTRWHEDDLAGRLLVEMEQGGEQWDVVTLPALAGEQDPLGRLPGTALWPAWYDETALRETRAAVGERNWSALYQQQPRPDEGTLFQAAKIEVMEAAPALGATVRAWDQAATAQVGSRDPDWTVGVKMRKTPEGRFVVLDVVRLRGGPEAVEQAIVNTAAQDGRGVKVRLPQDPGAAGKMQAFYLTKRLTGFTVESKPVTGDKATRAGPFASQVNVGNVSVVRAGWNRAFLDELAGFPGAAHDDQVDAAADAFGELIEPPRPARWVRPPMIMAR